MTSHVDDAKFVENNFNTISSLGKENYQETMDLIITTLEGTNSDFDESGMKCLLPDILWNSFQENQLAGGVFRAKPADPIPGIAPGPIPIEPPPPLTAAEMNYSALQLNHYNAKAATKLREDQKCQRFRAAKLIIKMTLINKTLALGDKTAHALLTNNRVTNRPDPRISIEDLLQNFIDGYSVPNDAAKNAWAATFDKPRDLNQPFKEFISTWTVARAKLNNTDRICTDYDLMRKFIAGPEHDPRVREFMMELRRLYPGTSQTWAQMMNLAAIQDANLDADIKLTHSAMSVTGITKPPVATTNTAGGTATVGPYCFIHGKPGHGKTGHNSDVCKMIGLNKPAYQYDKSNSITFTIQAQVNQARSAESSKLEVTGIGKGNSK